MIKHVVMWKFNNDCDEKIDLFLNGLKALDGVIEEIKYLEVAKNDNENNEFDAILISEFESYEDLNKYKVDPRHVEVSNICKSIAISRSCVDYKF